MLDGWQSSALVEKNRWHTVSIREFIREFPRPYRRMRPDPADCNHPAAWHPALDMTPRYSLSLQSTAL